MYAFIETNRMSSTAIGRLRGLLGASWGILGASWGLLRASRGGGVEFAVGAPLLGPLLGPSWGSLGPSWAPLGPSWGPPGPSSGPLGLSWCGLGGFLEALLAEP